MRGVGETEVNFPHEVTIDLGRNIKITGLELRLPFEGAAAASIEVFGSSQSGDGYSKLADKAIDKHSKIEVLEFDRNHRIRFLRIRFKEPLKAKSKLLMVGEIELR